MKSLITLAFSLAVIFANAAPGDTSHVFVHDKTDITWYGNYDDTGVFPDGSKTYRQILMHYTMGCASGGCSDWDYTTKIEIMPKMGIDTNTVLYPTFTVEGAEVDTFMYSNNPTFRTSFNESTLNTDSVYNDVLEVLFYEDEETPNVATRTENLYEAHYYNYYFDASGNIIDSIFVSEDGVHMLDHYEVREPFDVLEPFELARVITPYGTYMAAGSNGFNNDWNHTFTFDVTEFAPLLKDTLQVRAFYGGWSSGFSVSLHFEFIEGTPPRNTLSIENIYRGSWNYQNSNAFEANLPPTTVYPHPNTVGAEMRIIPTGHGFDNNLNCAEFCPRNYYLKIDGATKFTQQMWNSDCGLNPIYPQGGTWIYNRANWCPGGAATDYTHEITPHIAGKDSFELNMDLQVYNWSGEQAPSYIIDAQLIQYEDFNFATDAAISDVIAPSINENYARRNPICGRPVVKLKNYGGNDLTSVDIKYHVNENDVQTFQWSGNLKPLQEIELELPVMSKVVNTSGEFYAWTENPNGLTDENTINDKYTSLYDNSIDKWYNFISLQLRTNNNGYETTWELKNRFGNTIYTGNGLASNTTYNEEFEIEDGCYTLKIKDSGNDGLSWWANGAQGSGYARLRLYNVVDAINFKSDFGSEIRYPFIADKPNTNIVKHIKEKGIDVFPNPSNDGKFNLKFNSLVDTKNARITINDATGKVVKSVSLDTELVSSIDLSDVSKGVYILKFQNERAVIIKELIIE